MTTDIAQTGLKEPAQVDWDSLGGSKYQAPPDAFDAAGKSITYYGVVEAATQDTPDEENLNYKFDPIKLVKGGPGVDGYTIRFFRASTKVFTDKDGNPRKGNPNKLAQVVKSTGLAVKPQSNADYIAAVKAIVSQKKPLAFTIDWEAYNKDNQESVKGFFNFPVDPTTGRRKAVLHAGDVISLTDSKGVPTGETYTVKSDVLFANAKIKWLRDPSKGAQG